MAPCKYALLPFAAPATGTMDEGNEFPMLVFRFVKTVLRSEERRSIWPMANTSSAASGMNALDVGAERGCLGLSFDTEKELQAPILIDLEQLTVLDGIIDKYAERLRRERDARLEEGTTAEISDRIAKGYLKEGEVETRRADIRKFVADVNRWDREARSVTIYLSHGRQIEAQSFAEAIGQPLIQEETARGFLLSLRIGSVEAKIRAGHRGGEELAMEVEPRNSEISQELFGALENWASDIEATKWQQKWVCPDLFSFWLLFSAGFGPIAPRSIQKTLILNCSGEFYAAHSHF